MKKTTAILTGVLLCAGLLLPACRHTEEVPEETTQTAAAAETQEEGGLGSGALSGETAESAESESVPEETPAPPEESTQAEPEGQETESSSAEETEDLLPAPVTLTISFVGDCVIGKDEGFAYDTSFNAYHDTYGGDYFLERVRDVFLEDDMTVINMEGALTDSTARDDKTFAFKGPESYVDVFTGSSIEAANLANNHSYDYGEEGFEDTMNVLEENGIRTFGYERTAMLEVKGINVGIFGINELYGGDDLEADVRDRIASLKEEGADLVIAVFHWGREGRITPIDYELDLGHTAVDNGAAVVVGSHPHVLHGIETYNGRTIAYSLGNFVFGGNNDPSEYSTIILQKAFTLDEHRQLVGDETTILPCRVSSEYGYNNYQPMIVSGDAGAYVIDLLDERSSMIYTGE